MSGLVGGQKADTKAVEAQMAQQRAETEKLRQQAEEEKRSLAEQAAAKRMSRSRGGNRLLLAEERLNPEAGIDEQTLGAA
jgi:septal ring factor EnvC (AmiA/AmiB activator)